MKRILVIGSFMTDLVVTASRFVQEGETIQGDSFSQYPGGKGANQAVAAARLGGSVTILGKLGKDEFAKQQMTSLRANGVDCSHVFFTDQVGSGVGNPQLDRAGNNRIVVVPGANMTFTPEDIRHVRTLIEDSDIVVLQLEIPMETTYEAIRIAKTSGATIVLNPAPFQRIDEAYSAMVDWIIPNEHEAKGLSGIHPIDMDSARVSAEYLLDAGYGGVVITMGGLGSYARKGSEEFRVPAISFGPAVDTTAAGDSFIGAFAYGLSKSWSLERNMCIASMAAGITVTRRGAQPSLPSWSDIEKYVKLNKNRIPK